MAKQSTPAGGERVATLEAENKSLREEVDKLRKIVARVDHEKTLQSIPDIRTEFSDDIPGRIIALSSVGLFNHEIRAELGINRELWKEWQKQISAFASATSRARDLSLAYWHKIAREAVQSKDWKMPLSNLMRMIEDLKEDDAEEARGDASKLVHYSPGASQ